MRTDVGREGNGQEGWVCLEKAQGHLFLLDRREDDKN